MLGGHTQTPGCVVVQGEDSPAVVCGHLLRRCLCCCLQGGVLAGLAEHWQVTCVVMGDTTSQTSDVSGEHKPQFCWVGTAAQVVLLV
jgi:hypothetical protein